MSDYSQLTLGELLDVFDELDQNDNMLVTFVDIEAAREDYNEACITVSHIPTKVGINRSVIASAIGKSIYGKSDEPTIVNEHSLVRVGDWNSGSEPVTKEYIENQMFE